MASRREDLGSWLEGTPGGEGSGGSSRLGLPAAGPGSLAPVPRRLVGLVVDWVLSTAVATAFLSTHALMPLAVFAVSTLVLVATLGNTIGHRLVGLRVVRLQATARVGGAEPVPPPGLVPALVRTALLCLVIPAAIWDGSGRGMHDVAAGTAVVRR
ncbi:RDD family protein [Actinotalea sp. K2]|uniref:RDD family protein n=1 Tax=Actinotalea sp. K2 TaxID=2939438 RepID=UPI00201724DB|nr:RDD family protein [Actinotalea sp. K2]MCL3860706.1 RDD family protein [Actinotalea sp. K2]